MSNLYQTKRDDNILLKAYYEANKNKEIKIDQLNYKTGKITEFLNKKEAYIFLDKNFKNYDQLVDLIDTKIVTKNRNYQIDLESFVNKDFPIESVLKAFYSRIIFYTYNYFNKKKEAPKKNQYTFLLKDNSHKELANKFELIANNRNLVRNLQVMPENFCNSEQLAQYIVNDFKNEKDLKVTVLNKKEIEKLNMGLIISVNKGSTHEPRVVIVEYNGDPNSKEKIVYVGKGITFDTGGMNTKGYHMEGMKYDMSGSVIVAYTVKTLAQLKAKKNVAAIMCITDNRQDGDASLPENVYESMSGITVEVTDTDAEGRLVLADGLYYGAKKLNATTLVDVATLTGAVLRALGTVYSGIYSTDEKNWKIFNQAATNAKEKVWRMPLHEDFHEPNTASIVADLNNYNNDEKSDCNTAAMFLKQFTNDVPYIHCDVAGTADLSGKPQGVLVDTLVEFALLK
ncbi:M17 family metallopeptidase [Mycoplasmopsis fermentans]|uniref:M17 family metallopeptidase n=1 Tax=Mycoplasmopsis fermentans TaxID=2115 RepID=UPI0001E3303E|nr:leucyl aminopeptidase family protein [Mycoplasmopsis fermentans]ADN68847.1 probable cytosol aminopeptidase [Mycoplasmopsis fermentans JER]RMX35917.1 cytosol aminopeptidase family, catalytic domain protein [Mycoplasmopsis fermentans MF-I2]RMX36007.1 cytosol aminopeptidase family, catalytic domain protein [Mycoplasmopsis fermentans MF-I1]